VTKSQPSTLQFRKIPLYFTAKCNVQVRWSPNSAVLVAVLCDDYPNVLEYNRIHKGGQASSATTEDLVPKNPPGWVNRSSLQTDHLLNRRLRWCLYPYAEIQRTNTLTLHIQLIYKSPTFQLFNRSSSYSNWQHHPLPSRAISWKKKTPSTGAYANLQAWFGLFASQACLSFLYHRIIYLDIICDIVLAKLVLLRCISAQHLISGHSRRVCCGTWLEKEAHADEDIFAYQTCRGSTEFNDAKLE